MLHGVINYRNLDFFNILSYDYHSAYEPVVNHHAPLYSGGDPDDEYNFDAQLSIVN
jgi:chitinase